MALVTVSRDQIQDYLEECGRDVIKITEFGYEAYNGRVTFEWELNLYRQSDLEYEDSELYSEDEVNGLQDEIETLKMDKQVLEEERDQLTKERDQLLVELAAIKKQSKIFNWFK